MLSLLLMGCGKIITIEEIDSAKEKCENNDGLYTIKKEALNWLYVKCNNDASFVYRVTK